MGFFHQLRVLLWKNFILKKRCPFTSLLETFTPLVLFVILMLIRRREPSEHVGESYFTTMPLPSSGIIPVLQLFCPTYERDPFGFQSHPKSHAEEFLTELDKVVRENKLFNDDFSLGKIIVEMEAFNDLIYDKGSIEQRFAEAQDFSLKDILKNNSMVADYFVGNLSIPKSDAHQILNKKLNVSELFNLLYGFHPESLPFPPTNATNTSDANNGSDFSGSFLGNRLSGQCCGAVSKRLPAGELYSFDGLLGLLTLQPVGLLKFLKLDQPSANGSTLESVRLADQYKDLLLGPPELQDVMCSKDTGSTLYDANTGQLNNSGHVINDLCNRQDAAIIFDQLSTVLKDQIDTDALLEKLNITSSDLLETRLKALAVITELHKFAMFQETLKNLYNFALALPSGTCPEEVVPKPHVPTPLSPTTRPPAPSPSEMASTTVPTLPWDVDWDLQSDSQNDDINSSDSFEIHNATSPVTTVKTTTSPPPTESSQEQTKRPLSPKEAKSKKLSQLYKLWQKIQPALCGEELTANNEGLERGDFGSLHLNKHQKKSLGLLLHVLFSNPRILYAPNTTDVNDLIDKASDMIHLLENVTHNALMWHNISKEIRSYLHMSSTQLALDWLGQLEEDYSGHPMLFQNLTSLTSSDLSDLIANGSYVNTTSIETRLDVIDGAACGWLDLAGSVEFNVYQAFQDEESLIQYIMENAVYENVTVFASLIFEVDQDGRLPPHIVYKIRQNTSLTDRSDLIRRRFWAPGSEHFPSLGYYTYGFVWIQDIVERAIINKRVGRRVVEPGNYVREFPYPCFISNNFMYVVEHIMPMMLIVSWVYYVSMFTQTIVYEKEVRLKEVMKMMGLSNAVHWVAWFITGFVQMSVTIAGLITILYLGQILVHSNPIIVWLTMTIFAMATISFCFAVSVLFSKAKVASACAGIIYFSSYVPCLYIAIREESLAYVDVSGTLKTFASLLSTSAFGLGARYFALYEENGVGIQWNNLSLSPVEHDSFNLLRVMIMMIVDTLIYCLLAWYIEGVHPGSYGLPRPWYFPFQRSYWFSRHHGDVDHSICGECLLNCRRRQNSEPLSVTEENQACAMCSTPNSVYMEPDPQHLPLGVSIEQLSKVYQKGGKRAVNKLSLKFYEGQITSFLGHNGAGKTTTMSILTGLFPPSSGTAHVYGSDIRTDMTTIRKSLGMCPQHNALFDRLTVEEHIWFYCLLKGMQNNLIKAEITRIITDVGLLKKRHQVVTSLSGGMQRKLSVAIAFVGNSRTVILDEPTAGVDPCARRAIWELLIKYKQGRTIILSTHHMDEADILGDRIAILSNGQLKCVGSPLFLKTTFGDGYQLTLIKKPAAVATEVGDLSDSGEEPRNESFISECRERDVAAFIKDHVPRASLASETPRELTYTLPPEATARDTMEGLVSELTQERLEALNLSGYGLMDSSLEKVFLKVADIYSVNSNSIDGDSDGQTSLSGGPTVDYPLPANTTPPGEVEMSHVSDFTSVNPRMSHSQSRGGYSRLPQDDQEAGLTTGSHLLLTGLLLQLGQFRALMVKRFHYSRRNPKGLFTQLVLPAFFVSIAMSVALSAPKVGNNPPLVLSPSQYHPLTYPDATYSLYANEALNKRRSYHIYRSVDGDADPTQLTATFRYPAGIGASCVLKTPWNGTLDRLVQSSNYTSSVNLRGMFFDAMCEESFKKGEPLSNYVPEPPHPLPPPDESEFDDDDSNDLKPEGSTYIKEKTCFCSEDGNGFICPPNVGEPAPPSEKVITSDILFDISGRNMSEYILYTTDKFRLRRYGGVSFGNVRTFVPQEYSNIVPDSYRSIAVRNAAIAWYSHKGYHSLPTYVNVLNNAILRANLDPGVHGNPSAYGITVINHPVNKTGWRLEEEFVNQESTNVLIAIFIIVAMSFVPASFVVFLVTERSTKAKHLQMVSGMRPLVYWISNLTWDMMTYLLPATCCILILILFDIPAYSSATNLPGVIALFLLYGFSMTPIMYPASFFFTESSSAYVTLIVCNLFTGITSLLTTFILEIFNTDSDLELIYSGLDKFFLIFPNYCLGTALMDLSFNEYMNEYYYMIGLNDEIKSPYRWELLYRTFLIMAAEGILAFVFTLLCEYRFFIKPRRSSSFKTSLMDEAEVDEDVLEEKKRVLSGQAKNDVLCIKNLSKVYKLKRFGNHLAVDKLCLGVPQGECFGLLGVNGAGKTTTFKMLTGDEPISGGDATLSGYSVYNEMKKVQRLIGYCPQFDALFDELNAREHLTLYARLKGIPTNQQKQMVEWAVTRVALAQYANKPVSTYSGGNKRKLSTAIALLGNPPVIFMDEPTTGMDPHSRRFLWELISSIIREGRSIILTSHSIEECEVLCTRLAIMVNGHLHCLGSAQHLRNKYGDGYTVIVRVKGHDPDLQPLKGFFIQTFPHAVLKDEHHNVVHYEIPLEHVDLTQLFGRLQDVQDSLQIEDYSISQTTLDNVFVNFAEQQLEKLDMMDSEAFKRRQLGIKKRLRQEEREPLVLDDRFLLKEDVFFDKEAPSRGNPVKRRLSRALEFLRGVRPPRADALDDGWHFRDEEYYDDEADGCGADGRYDQDTDDSDEPLLDLGPHHHVGSERYHCDDDVVVDDYETSLTARRPNDGKKRRWPFGRNNEHLLQDCDEDDVMLPLDETGKLSLMDIVE